MLHCWPRQEQVAGHLENKSQAVNNNALQTHNLLSVVELVFFSHFAELQRTPVSVKLHRFLLDLQDTKPQMRVEAGEFAARKTDASAGSLRARFCTILGLIHLLLKLGGK